MLLLERFIKPAHTQARQGLLPYDAASVTDTLVSYLQGRSLPMTVIRWWRCLEETKHHCGAFSPFVFERCGMFRVGTQAPA